MMFYPKVNIVKVSDSYIYLANILKWGKNNPDLADAQTLTISDLASQLDDLINPFAAIFSKHENRILSELPSITGYDWDPTYASINVYPIPFLNSLSHPLFLRVCSISGGKLVPRKPALLLGLLIHELCHNNMGPINVSRETNEMLIHFVTMRLLSGIQASYVEDYLAFQKRIGSVIDYNLIPAEVQSGRLTIAAAFRLGTEFDSESRLAA
jgi:hypothetical protein